MRKDVECIFGILKGQFRILKTGIRVHCVDAADNIWMTCCTIDNMLLEIDGLIEYWSGKLGLFYFDKNSEQITFALQRLDIPSLIHTYDSSGMGPGPKPDDSDVEEDIHIIDGEDNMDGIVISENHTDTTMNM